jgi:S1-C subfamily serine protease
MRIARGRIRITFLLATFVALATAAVSSARDEAPAGAGVVTITTRLGYQGAAAAGTGMVVTPSGEVLTNNHVIAGATTITATVPGTGRRYSAQVAGYDVQDDVAVLRLNGAANLRTVSPDASAKVFVGQRVRAVGNANGTGSLASVTGRVTGVGKAITAQDQQGSSERLTGLIETNAGVVAGDSGGPLLNADGKVIGVVTAASTNGSFAFEREPASAAFAIPIGKALRIAGQIEAGRSSAAVHVGPTAFLGVQVGASDDGSAGAVVVSVVPGGPADTAGLVAGDQITRLGTRAISSPSVLSGYVLTRKPGERVTVRYLDLAGTHTVTVRLGTGPPR